MHWALDLSSFSPASLYCHVFPKLLWSQQLEGLVAAVDDRHIYLHEQHKVRRNAGNLIMTQYFFCLMRMLIIHLDRHASIFDRYTSFAPDSSTSSKHVLGNPQPSSYRYVVTMPYFRHAIDFLHRDRFSASGC